MMNLLNSTYKKETARQLDCQRALLYDASRHENHFCHHGHICAFQGRLYAMWSNGREGEGEIGQKILYAVSSDGLAWSEPRPLFSDGRGPASRKTLVPAGWLVREDCLTAYAGVFSYVFPRRKKYDASGLFRYGDQCTGTSLFAMTSGDGLAWSKPLNMHVPLCPNMGPQRLQSGRLMITGNFMHAYTDDPAGLTGWKTTSFCKGEDRPVPFRDDPSAFWKVSRDMGIPGSLCEGAFIQTKDGILHMLYRSYSPLLFESQSYDNGETWSYPVLTNFPDGNSKFFLGTLPDGRYIYIGNPGPGTGRRPLVLSLSDDGVTFREHYLLEDAPVSRKYPGAFKNGMYAYPHAAVHQEALYVIYTVWKEDVWVMKIPLALLRAGN